MSVDDAVRFGHLVRERRRELDLTQAQLAEQVGCSVELVRKIERGERRPSRETAARLLRFLNLEDAALPDFVAAARTQPTPLTASLPQSHPTPPPAPAVTLVGRDAELSSLTRLLANPQCRLITLTGPGGVGKTHLALTAVQQAHFPDGTGYTALENVNTPERLPLALATASGLNLAGPDDPARQLAAYLRGRRMLLLLDNFEHLTGGAVLLAELLREAPGLRLLVTSRERLGLPGEWLVELQGLSLTPAGGAAFALFVRQAERARGTPLPPDEHADAVRICRLLDGVPLALELAAGWARSLSCAEIADELTRSLDFLESGAHDLPPRQRSISAVFDSSWGLLDEQQRTYLYRLAVFADGFDRHAAAEVAGAGSVALAALIDRSLLRREAGGRYTIQPLLREFAARQLAAVPDAEDVRTRHARHFAGLLSEALPRLRSAGQEATLATLLTERTNLRLAWEWAVARHDADLVGRALKTLWYLHEICGWQREGVALFAAAAAVWGDESTIAAELHAAHGWFLLRLGHLAEARPPLERALALGRTLAVPQTLATALDYLGLLELHSGNPVTARTLLSESLAIHRATGNTWGEAFALAYLDTIINGAT